MLKSRVPVMALGRAGAAVGGAAAPAPKFKRDMAAADVLGLNMSLADWGGLTPSALFLLVGTGEAMVNTNTRKILLWMNTTAGKVGMIGMCACC